MSAYSYSVEILKAQDQLPLRDRISAVFLVAFSDGKVLSVRNERGWDVPGGYLEGEENILDGLRREIDEEAGAVFEGAEPYAVLLSQKSSRVMVFFVAPSCRLETFTPSEDALERDLLPVGELISRYHGDKALLGQLLEEAQKKIS